MDARDEPVERLLADVVPDEPLEERRVFAELHDALFGGQAKPVTLSRYVVLDRIGHGGLGVVYAGYDPQLDRKVAIKLLQPRPGTAPVAETHARLLGEARVLARLAHPNVVAVHDVGTYDESELPALHRDASRPPGRGVFVVMELVAGVDLSRWLAARRHGWREVLDVFLEAGRGLAAAHAAGIVHRDFKPANVIVGDDGRTRVLDFGLARALAPGTPDVAIEPAPASSRARDAQPRMTRSGAVLGTPAYMAPEQHRGLASDARSDEFAFFAALYEGIVGALPFPASDPDRLAADKDAGRIAAPPRGARRPPALQRAIVRGLSPEPAARFPTMEDALHELQRIHRGWRRPWPWIVAGAALTVAASVAGLSVAEDSPCERQAQRLDGIWDDAIRREVQHGLAATGARFADATWVSVERALDRYAEDLVRARTAACEATLVRGDRDLAVMQRATQCLDRRMARLRELTTLLRDPDGALAERAVDAASSLPPLSACELPLLDAGGSSPAGSPQREEIERLLARAEALLDAGRFDAATTPAQQAVDEAASSRDAALSSDASRVLGLAQREAGDLDAAERSLHAALVEAERAGDDDAAARAMVELLATAQSRARYDEGERLAELARARLQYRGLHDDLDARLALEIGRLRHAQGRNDDAYAELQEALQLTLAVWGEQHARVADVLNELGNSLDRQGRYGEAMQHYQHSLTIRRALLGEEHPRVGASLNNVGNVQASLGQHEDALATYRSALAIYEASLGPQHPRTAAIVNNVAIVLSRMGRPEDALREHRRALAIRERVLPSDHPLVALDHNNIGSVLAKLGRREEALDEYRIALQAREQRLGSEHPDVAHTLDNIAITLGQLGRWDEAVAGARRALRIREAALGAEHLDVATSMLHLGGLLRRTGEREAARGLIERALELRTRVLGETHPAVAEARAEQQALAAVPAN